MAIDRMSIAQISTNLGVAWNTARAGVVTPAWATNTSPPSTSHPGQDQNGFSTPTRSNRGSLEGSLLGLAQGPNCCISGGSQSGCDGRHHRLPAGSAKEEHVTFEVTWCVRQSVIDASQAEKPATGKKLMTEPINSIHTGVPAELPEVRILGGTMQRRRDEIVAYFKRLA